MENIGFLSDFLGVVWILGTSVETWKFLMFAVNETLLCHAGHMLLQKCSSQQAQTFLSFQILPRAAG